MQGEKCACSCTSCKSKGLEFSPLFDFRDTPEMSSLENSSSSEQEDFIETKPFLCTMCHAAFTDKEDLVSHCAIHTIDIKPQLSCEKCDMVFEQRHLLDEHMEIHDQKNLSFCSVCKLVLMEDESGTEYRDDSGQLLCTYCFLSQGKEKISKAVGSIFIVEEKKKPNVRKNKKPVKKNSAGQNGSAIFPGLDIDGEGNVDMKKDDKTPKKKKQSPIKKGEKREKQKLLDNISEEDKKEGPLQCTFCPKTFILQHNLDKHLEKHSNVEANKCSICNKSFNRTNYLKQHMLIHTGEKPVQCTLCERTFRQKTELTRHMRNHTGEKPYKCTECPEAYVERIYLKRHMINVHNIGTKPFLCSQCPRRFLRRSELNEHVLTHTGERPHSCDQCGESFRQRYLLKRHLMLHAGLKPESRRSDQPKEKCQCTQCGKILADKDGLRKHMRRHRGEETVYCEICFKKFCTRGTLRRHQNVHTGFKPFECDDCGKKFTQKINMINHKSKACPVHMNGKRNDPEELSEESFDPVHFPELDD